MMMVTMMVMMIMMMIMMTMMMSMMMMIMMMMMTDRETERRRARRCILVKTCGGLSDKKARNWNVTDFILCINHEQRFQTLNYHRI